ncbi:MAG: MarR family transcriptional regulator [Acidimicrobiales bacterium]
MADETWTFLTNHAHVLLVIHREPGLRQRDIAEMVGVTEGAVQRIVGELEAGGYLRRERQGRRNVYSVAYDATLRHRLDAGRTVGELLGALDPVLELSHLGADAAG